MNDFVLFIFFLLLLSFIDCFFVIHSRARWFILHTITNTLVVIAAFPDFLQIVIDPRETPVQKSSQIPPNLTFALHIYHILAFRNLTNVDWVHHTVMCCTLFISYFYSHPKFTNFILFIVNGLPGAIDYALLALVKYEKISRLTEKRINAKLNVWFRGPLLVISSFLTYEFWLYGYSEYSLWGYFIIISSLFWNGQYFTERVVHNYGYYSGESVPRVCC